MTDGLETRRGYIRAQADLKLLDSSAVQAFANPGSGYLDLLTEDGRLRLTLSRNVAEDLMIDLQQFLAAKPHTADR